MGNPLFLLSSIIPVADLVFMSHGNAFQLCNCEIVLVNVVKDIIIGQFTSVQKDRYAFSSGFFQCLIFQNGNSICKDCNLFGLSGI